jgi:hypothetical protein
VWFSMFFLIRYQTVVASRRLINFARQFFRRSHSGAHDGEQPPSSSYASLRAPNALGPSVGFSMVAVISTVVVF